MASDSNTTDKPAICLHCGSYLEFGKCLRCSGTGTKTTIPSVMMLTPGERITVRYRNWRGETAVRRIEVDGVPHWGSTEWHPEFQWLIRGTDLDKNEQRIWAIKDMEPVS